MRNPDHRSQYAARSKPPCAYLGDLAKLVVVGKIVFFNIVHTKCLFALLGGDGNALAEHYFRSREPRAY